ncbi:MAG: hypothetical protein K6E29_05830 [Cyanobacteria bacterium RUI128]|nr:hypothetical protein [Cyanobacteria bacterium RUI128]
MIKQIQNTYDYLKYGKKVYESASGTVIRRKTTSPKVLYNGHKEVCSTKTVLDKDRNVCKTIFRSTELGDETLKSFVATRLYEQEAGKLKETSFKTKEYIVKPDEKKLVDNSKPAYDFKITKLPDGKKEYEIAFPEVTVIRDGIVTTTQKSAKGIIEG